MLLLKETNSVNKRIISMILPITAENVLQMTAGIVSMAMIGRINTISVGALGISTRITQIVWALFKGIATGTSVFAAQSYGAGDTKRLRETARHSLLSALVLVIILQQLIFWNAPFLLSIFNPEPEMFFKGLEYLRIVSWGLPFVVIMLITAGILQGTGNSKTPMKIALIMNICNLILSYFLIFGMPIISPMGIRGAGVALVTAQFIGAALGLYMLFNRDGILGLMGMKEFFNINIKQVISLYRVGVPSSLESVFWQVSAVILTIIMLSFGDTAFAAYQLGLQAESISFMPATGFGIAATTFIGQSLGAREKELGRKYMHALLKGAMLITCITTFILIVFPQPVMTLMTNNQDVIKLGAVYLFLMGLVQIPQNLSGVLNGAMRGAGFTRVPMIVAGAGIWGIRIPISYVLTHYFHFGIVSIWVVMCIDLLVRFVLNCILYKTKNIYNGQLVFESSSQSR
jgi:putative MATE family efflux protein